MPKIHALKTFTFAPEGHTVVEYAEGEEHEVTDLCAEVAVAEGWAKLPGATKPAKTK